MKKILAGFALLLPIISFADTQNDIKSCYDAMKVAGKNDAINKEVFIFIDQTTIFDNTLKNSVIKNATKFIMPSNAYSVAKFSAFINNNYAGVVSAGKLDAPMPDAQKNDTPKQQLMAFNKCEQQQIPYASKLMSDAINQTFSDATTNISRSDIYKSLQSLSNSVVKTSKAKEKVVILASDMLENSSVSSFYANNGVRLIDPKAEIAKAEKAGLLSDFAGAKVYVIGAGIMAPNPQNKNNYRDPQKMQALNEFWKMYFEKSNAKLVEFGTPALLGSVE